MIKKVIIHILMRNYTCRMKIGWWMMANSRLMMMMSGKCYGESPQLCFIEWATSLCKTGLSFCHSARTESAGSGDGFRLGFRRLGWHRDCQVTIKGRGVNRKEGGKTMRTEHVCKSDELSFEDRKEGRRRWCGPIAALSLASGFTTLLYDGEIHGRRRKFHSLLIAYCHGNGRLSQQWLRMLRTIILMSS